MIKLYIKQKLLSAIERFSVKNELEEDCYLVEGDTLVIGGKKLHIKDLSGSELAMIHQKLLSLQPKFYVYRNGEQVAEIVKKFSLFKPKYVINGPGWEVRGSIMNHDYSIMKDGSEIVSLHKAWLSWGDSYELRISDSADEILALAVVLAIDCVLQAQAESQTDSSTDSV